MERRKTDLPDWTACGVSMEDVSQRPEAQGVSVLTHGIGYPLALGIAGQLRGLAAGCGRRGRQDSLDGDGHGDEGRGSDRWSRVCFLFVFYCCSSFSRSCLGGPCLLAGWLAGWGRGQLVDVMSV